MPELQAARGLRRRAPALPGAGGRRAPVHEMDVRRMFGGRAEAVVRTPADKLIADAQEAEAAAAAALRASGTTPSTAPSWVAQLAPRGGQKSRRVAQQQRLLCGPSKSTLRRRDAEAQRTRRYARPKRRQLKQCSSMAGVLNRLGRPTWLARWTTRTVRRARKRSWRKWSPPRTTGAATSTRCSVARRRRKRTRGRPTIC